MQAVADRLGVTPMALYRYEANKADLLDEITPPDGAARWDDQLLAMGQAVRAVAHRHPSVFPLLLQRPASTPAAHRVRDRVCEILRSSFIRTEDVAQAERLISTMVLGFAVSEVSGRFDAHSRKGSTLTSMCWSRSSARGSRGTSRPEIAHAVAGSVECFLELGLVGIAEGCLDHGCHTGHQMVNWRGCGWSRSARSLVTRSHPFSMAVA